MGVCVTEGLRREEWRGDGKRPGNFRPAILFRLPACRCWREPSCTAEHFMPLTPRSDPRGRSTLCQSDDDGHWVQNERLDSVATSTLRGDRFDINSGGEGGPIVAGDQRAVMVAAIRARNRLVARCTE